MINFAEAFHALTGNAPFPWQAALYERFLANDIPATCSLPTGLGKTSIIAVWLIALAKQPETIPRRLVYVVNRRTVVDQTTVEVEMYRKNLSENLALKEIKTELAKLCAIPLKGGDSPLAISTLRGQFADNREWSTDPARPAVICGTVDMIGSRLLFSGYGIGWKSKPLHAGFLGQDVLLVHDEAHLEQPFQELLKSMEQEQGTGERIGKLPWKKLHVMELTATPRIGDTAKQREPFELTAQDLQDPTVKQRFNATKKLSLIPLKDAKKPVGELAEQALQLEKSGTAVLVFARSVEDVMGVAERLGKQKLPCVTLTGTMRGKERDGLVDGATFARFLPRSNRPKDVTPTEGTVYLVCTSAGEVGVNISADHMVCDLSPFDSMAQRFGRVNRFGERDDSTITVLHPTTFDDKNKLDPCREKTLTLLRELDGDASPQGLSKFDPTAKTAAFTPTPMILPATDILYDSWALTTIRDKLPGRPSVDKYLHGLADWEPPQTQVAWRDEVGIIQGELLKENEPKDLLDIFPLKAHELLSDRTDRVFDRLKKLPQGLAEPSMPVWVIANDGAVKVTTIGIIVAGDKEDLEATIVLLPPALGGLRDGMLNASSHVADDVSCEFFADVARQQPLRSRWRSEESICRPREEMRLLLRIDTRPGDEGETDDADNEHRPSNPVMSYRYWFWYERVDRGDELGGRTSKQKISWDHHTDDVTSNANKIADKLLAHSPDLHRALVTAARWHDLGKKREVWQRSIGRPASEMDQWYAKSDPTWPSEVVRTPYRHEFGSLVDIQAVDAIREEFEQLPQGVQDLVLHLIAVHHGYGRPHFSEDRAFDPEPRGTDPTEIASEVPRRYARLQRQYGRWGLAYLESLLRAADAAASAYPTDAETPTEEARP